MTILTYLVDKHAQQTIEYLKEENKILFQKLEKKRLVMTDQERRRLAVKAKPLGQNLGRDNFPVLSRNHPRLVPQRMKQVARNLTDSEEGFLRSKRFLILDRDPLFTKAFKEMLKDGCVTPVPTAVAAPMMNAHAERFVRAVKYECVNKPILTNEAQLRYVLGEYLEYYHHERFHKGLGRIIEPRAEYQAGSGRINGGHYDTWLLPNKVGRINAWMTNFFWKQHRHGQSKQTHPSRIRKPYPV